MADSKDKVVVQAHGLRTTTALAALLHGSRRGPRELRRPYAAIIASLVIGALLLVGVWAVSTIADLLAEQRRQRALPEVAVVRVEPDRLDQRSAQSKPPNTAITSGTSATTASISSMSSS
ncbi:hypothetical protein [Plantactinospora sp. GCM10030261]|uniref:hypothetical protein n=1 Tax=Plantactinospora sp. GCM10030261 TaxID=3273420 RepID=UPI0036067FC8